MKTKIYARVGGEVQSWTVNGKARHVDAIASLKAAGVKYHGAVMMVYF